MVAGSETADFALPHIHDLAATALADWQRHAAEAAGREVMFHDTLDDGGPGPPMVVIPPGSFEMGSTPEEIGHRPDESPRHLVRMERSFAVGLVPVTASEFEVYARQVGHRRVRELVYSKGRHPAINLRLVDALAFAAWLSERSGARYRLPTEAEWEYAARAGSSGPFCFGGDLGLRQACFDFDYPYHEHLHRDEFSRRRIRVPRWRAFAMTREVGRYPPNAWGLRDMHGNVWELCDSDWTENYLGCSRQGNFEAPSRGRFIVARGGSWFDGAERARSAARQRRLREELDVNVGFRLVRELD